MAARKSDFQLEREKRRDDLNRLDELFVRILGLGGPPIRGLDDLARRLRRIQDAVISALRHNLQVTQMLDLLDTLEATRELVFHLPKIMLDNDGDEACEKIWMNVYETRNTMLRM